MIDEDQSTSTARCGHAAWRSPCGRGGQSLDSGQVIAGLREAVGGHGITVGGEFLDVAVGLHFHGRAAVAEVPGLAAVGGAEGAHLEGDRVAGMDVCVGA